MVREVPVAIAMLKQERKNCGISYDAESDEYGLKKDYRDILFTPFEESNHERVTQLVVAEFNRMVSVDKLERGGFAEGGFMFNSFPRTDLRFITYKKIIIGMCFKDGNNYESNETLHNLVTIINDVVRANRLIANITPELTIEIQKRHNRLKIQSNKEGNYIDPDTGDTIFWKTDPKTCLKYAMVGKAPDRPRDPEPPHVPEFNVGDCVETLDFPKYYVTNKAPAKTIGKIKSIRERYSREPFHYFVYTVEYTGYDNGEYEYIYLKKADGKCRQYPIDYSPRDAIINMNICLQKPLGSTDCTYYTPSEQQQIKDAYRTRTPITLNNVINKESKRETHEISFPERSTIKLSDNVIYAVAAQQQSSPQAVAASVPRHAVSSPHAVSTPRHAVSAPHAVASPRQAVASPRQAVAAPERKDLKIDQSGGDPTTNIKNMRVRDTKTRLRNYTGKKEGDVLFTFNENTDSVYDRGVNNYFKMGGRTAVFKIKNDKGPLILRVVDESIYKIEQFINKYKSEQKLFGKYMIDIIQYGIIYNSANIEIARYTIVKEYKNEDDILRLSRPLKINLMKQLLELLQQLDKQTYVMTDLKLPNIGYEMISPDNIQLKIIDYDPTTFMALSTVPSSDYRTRNFYGTYVPSYIPDLIKRKDTTTKNIEKMSMTPLALIISELLGDNHTAIDEFIRNNCLTPYISPWNVDYISSPDNIAITNNEFTQLKTKKTDINRFLCSLLSVKFEDVPDIGVVIQGFTRIFG